MVAGGNHNRPLFSVSDAKLDLMLRELYARVGDGSSSGGGGGGQGPRGPVGPPGPPGPPGADGAQLEPLEVGSGTVGLSYVGDGEPDLSTVIPNTPVIAVDANGDISTEPGRSIYTVAPIVGSTTATLSRLENNHNATSAIIVGGESDRLVTLEDDDVLDPDALDTLIVTGGDLVLRQGVVIAFRYWSEGQRWIETARIDPYARPDLETQIRYARFDHGHSGMVTAPIPLTDIATISAQRLLGRVDVAGGAVGIVEQVQIGTTSTISPTWTDSGNFLDFRVRDDSILNQHLGNMVQSRIKGRAAGAGTGDPQDLTAAEVLTLLNVPDIPVQISEGGTGQTTQTAAFDALGPGTTKGDIIVHDGTDHIRLGVGSDGQVLTADAAQASGVKWATPSGVGNVYSTIADVDGGSATASGSDTIKFVTGVPAAVIPSVLSNDPTHGDHVVFDFDETVVNHDNLLGFVGNEHIDHSAITLTAGDGLSGGGDLTASRSFSVNVDGSTIETSSDALRIKDAGVTNAKLANMAESTVKGRAAGAGTGVPTDLTATQVRTLLGIGAGADVVGPGSSTDNAAARYDGTTGKLLQNSGLIIDDVSSGTLGLRIASANNVIDFIRDTHGTILTLLGVGNGVNNVGIQSAATGNTPLVAVIGSDPNINLNLVSKGTGVVQANGIPIVTTTATQTLTNKTLTQPNIADFTLAGHDHLDTDDGGTLTPAAIIVSATDKLLARVSSGSGVAEEVTFTDFAQSLVDDADAAAARTTLGLGTAAVLNSPIGISNGGTGQTTATAAFDALAPTTTTGDISYYNGTDNVRLGIGSTADALRVNGGVPKWITDTFAPSTSGIQASFDGSTLAWSLNISALTADASPDSAADYVATYDTSAGVHKKVLLSNLPGGGSLTSHNHTSAGGDGGVLTNDEHDGFIDIAEIATPANPATDHGRLFCRANGANIELVFLSSQGAECVLCSLPDNVVNAELQLNLVE